MKEKVATSAPVIKTIFIMNYLADLKEVFPDKNLIDIIYDAYEFREPSVRGARVKMTDDNILSNVKFYHKAKVKRKNNGS